MSSLRNIQEAISTKMGSPARKKGMVDMPAGRNRSRVFRRGGSTRVSFMSQNSQASIKTLNGAESDFLHAAEFGDIPGVRRLVGENPDLNVDCIDILGRTALKLAVKNEHLEVVELLLDKSSINHIYEAALQAISAGHVPIAECILKHKRYLDLTRDRRKFGATDSFFTTLDLDESQFSPDVTPLILASQKNQYEIVQLLLLRGETIPRPHRFNCHCKECFNKTEFDQLRLAISRLNAYRGLASEAYVSLSSKDPILTAFELASELRRLAHVEKYFRTEYYQLADNLSDYVVKLLDRVRTHDELEMVLNKTGKGGSESFSKLARFKLALRYGEKKFIAHPACQQRLVNIWYAGMRKLERSSWPQRIILMIGFILLYPFLFLIYIVAPGSKGGAVLKYPCVKFLIHAVSFITFLGLIIMSTLETSFENHADKTLAILHPDIHQQYTQYQNQSGRIFFDPNFTLRSFMPTVFQALLVIWTVGFLCQECSQLYTDGMTAYRKSLYNMLDYAVICTYTASFTLYGLSMIKVHLSLKYLREQGSLNTSIEDYYYYTYWLNADRFYWKSFDPINIAEGLFAMGNIISFSRISYLLPANEALGPMQISLGRMIKDILKFLAVFILVMMAFLIGLHNLFWYYSARKNIETVERNITTRAEIYFGTGLDTFRTIFWSVFGRGEYSVVELDGYDNTVTQDIGYIIYGVYNVASVTVLLNMLIAMMTRSFENIAGDADVEWKFGRSQLYMDYIAKHSVLPVPLNLLAVPKGIFHALANVCGCCSCSGCCSDEEEESSHRRRNGFSGGKQNPAYEETSVTEHTVFDPKKLSKFDQITSKPNVKETLTYEKVMQRVIKRYIFELEREAEVTEDDFEEIKQDISSFRYEILNLLKMKEENSSDSSNFTKVAHMVQCLREDMFSMIKSQGVMGREAIQKSRQPISSLSSAGLRQRITEEDSPSIGLGESASGSFDKFDDEIPEAHDADSMQDVTK